MFCFVLLPNKNCQIHSGVTYIPPSITRERMRPSTPARCRFTTPPVSTTLRPLQPTLLNNVMDGRENSWKDKVEGMREAWDYTSLWYCRYRTSLRYAVTLHRHDLGSQIRVHTMPTHIIHSTHMADGLYGADGRVRTQTAHWLSVGVISLLQDKHVLCELGSLICHPAGT